MYRTRISRVTIFASSKRHLAKIAAAFAFLRKADTRRFQKTTKLIGTIISTDRVQYSNALFPKDRVWISGAHLMNDPSFPPEYIASLLVHEAHHIAQHRAGRASSGARSERNAYREQRRFLQKAHYPEAVSWLDRQYARKWWRGMDRDQRGMRIFRQLLRCSRSGTLTATRLSRRRSRTLPCRLVPPHA